MYAVIVVVFCCLSRLFFTHSNSSSSSCVTAEGVDSQSRRQCLPFLFITVTVTSIRVFVFQTVLRKNTHIFLRATCLAILYIGFVSVCLTHCMCECVLYACVCMSGSVANQQLMCMRNGSYSL